MSTRFYPRFVRGNPQLRIFLPDWKMVLIKSKENLPKNVVAFKTDVRMTDWDIKNYLEKIYKVQIGGLQSKIMGGDLKRTSKGLSKEDDYKVTLVTLLSDQEFKWPNLFPAEKSKEELDDYKRTLNELKRKREIDPNKSGLPTWLS